MKRVFLRFAMIMGLASVLTSCVTDHMFNRNQVVVTKKPVASQCKWMGKVSSAGQTNTTMTTYNRHQLRQMKLNDLRQQATALNANTVVLNKKTVRYCKKRRSMVTYRLEGDAYWCP